MMTSKLLRGASLVFASAALFCQAQSPLVIQLSPSKPGVAVPADFVGLSFEMQYVLPDTNGNHFFSPNNKSLVAMFKTLGIRSLRVGGNTADRPTLPTPRAADVDSLFAFAKAADVKVIYTLRLNQGSVAGQHKWRTILHDTMQSTWRVSRSETSRMSSARNTHLI